MNKKSVSVDIKEVVAAELCELIETEELKKNIKKEEESEKEDEQTDSADEKTDSADEKSEVSENKIPKTLTVKLNVVNIDFSDVVKTKKWDKESKYLMRIKIYHSSTLTNIQKSKLLYIYPAFFTSYSTGLFLCVEAFSSIQCGNESSRYFKIVVSCCKEKSLFKGKVLKVYSRIFQAPVALGTYALSKDKKYGKVTYDNEILFDKAGTVIFQTI